MPNESIICGTPAPAKRRDSRRPGTDSVPRLPQIDIAIKRLEVDFRATIDVSRDAFVDQDAELPSFGPFAPHRWSLCRRCGLDLEIAVDRAIVGVHFHCSLEVCREGHVNVAIQRTGLGFRDGLFLRFFSGEAHYFSSVLVGVFWELP